MCQAWIQKEIQKELFDPRQAQVGRCRTPNARLSRTGIRNLNGDGMKHAGAEALTAIETLLADLRKFEGLVEKRPGVFYRMSKAFLHFHQDPAGMFADVRIDGEWQRLPVNTAAERRR
jgi:hypothetical protein